MASFYVKYASWSWSSGQDKNNFLMTLCHLHIIMACQEASTIMSICIRPSDDVCLNVGGGVFENSDGDGKGLDLSDDDTF